MRPQQHHNKLEGRGVDKVFTPPFLRLGVCLIRGVNLENGVDTKAPTLHPNLLNLAWAAGIFEGEGSVNSNGFSLQVYQKDPHILHQLRNWFGGSVRVRKNGTYEPIHTWTLCGARARGFAQSIFSFLSPRRRNQIKPLITK